MNFKSALSREPGMLHKGNTQEYDYLHSSARPLTITVLLNCLRKSGDAEMLGLGYGGSFLIEAPGFGTPAEDGSAIS